MSVTEDYTELFRHLCEKSEPEAFLAITVDADMMTSFACAGVTTEDAVSVLEQMADYLRSQLEEKEEDEQPTKH